MSQSVRCRIAAGKPLQGRAEILWGIAKNIEETRLRTPTKVPASFRKPVSSVTRGSDRSHRQFLRNKLSGKRVTQNAKVRYGTGQPQILTLARRLVVWDCLA